MMRNAKPAPALAIGALPKPQVAETPVTKATRSMLAKMDAQHEEITRLLSEVRAALG
jgi:hypothetical protein